jgi:hypothetical protein
MKTTLKALLGLMCLTFLAIAADVTGKYTAEITTQRGTQTSTFTFKTSGDKVEGSIGGQRGDTPIADGKLNGDTLTFTVTRSFGGNEIKQTYTGKVKGDTIEFTVEGGRGPQTFTAKKAQ